MRKSDKFRTWSRSRAPRLPPLAYSHGFPVHVVLCTHERQPFFSESPPLAAFVFQWITEAPETLAGCLMPDHLHWLLKISRPPAAWVGQLKVATISAARNLGLHPPLWQRSYFDRVIWSEEALCAEARYIGQNPERAKLVEPGAPWPYTLVRI